MTKILFSWFALLSYGCVAAADLPATDLYPAVSKGKTGYINREGKVTIPFLFEDGQSFSQGLAAVLMDGRWGYINEKAEVAIQPVYQHAGMFSEGLALVQLQGYRGKYGFIDKGGSIVVEPRYSNAGNFSEGFAVVSNDRGKLALVDKTGKTPFNSGFLPGSISGFSEGLIFGYLRENRLPVYLDKNGEIAIRIDTTGLEGFVVQGSPFSDGMAAVQIKGKWGYIDRKGEMAISPQYAKATAFRRGLACVAVEEIKNNVGRWTSYIIDKQGARLRQVPTIWGTFSEGLAPFERWIAQKRTCLFGYIDTRGETVIPPRFDNALPFQNGIARVILHGNDAYIDKQGRTIWIGESRGDDPIASYSGKSMLDMYEKSLRNEHWKIANFYTSKMMNRADLVKGSRITLKWLLEDPKRTSSCDLSRRGTIGMAAVAPFLQTYSFSFTKEQKPIDLAPFLAMLADKTLDVDYRRELADCFEDDDFYIPSWEHIVGDTETICMLVRDSSEDEILRVEASETSLTLILRLYEGNRREIIDASAEKTPVKYPDIIAVLDRKPCPLAPPQKVHWESLVNCMEKAVGSALELYEQTQIEKSRKTIYLVLKRTAKCRVLRNRELSKRVDEIIAENDNRSHIAL